MFIAETKRLLLREMTTDDAESAYLLNLDPEVIKYTGDDSFTSIDDARTFLLNYDHYKKYGYGRWAVILKDTNEYLGWCGLKCLEEENKYDLGYRLMKKHWNKGYASEAANKCLEIGFKQFNMDSIVAHSDIENVVSIRVLEKLGLSFQKHYYEMERKCAAYKINKEEYEELRSKNVAI